jgi:hypothetical protein
MLAGKSFLLNSLLEDTTSYFGGFKGTFIFLLRPLTRAVGSKVDPQTMGLWVLPTNMTGSDGSRVLLLDSEGFFGSSVSEM